MYSQEIFDEIKKRFDAGKIAIDQTAQDDRVDATEEKAFSEIGWIRQGADITELDQATFAPGQAGQRVTRIIDRYACSASIRIIALGRDERLEEDRIGES